LNFLNAERLCGLISAHWKPPCRINLDIDAGLSASNPEIENHIGSDASINSAIG